MRTRVNYTLTITADNDNDLTEADHIEIADALGDHMGIGTVGPEAVTVETAEPVGYETIAVLAAYLKTNGYSLKAKPLTDNDRVYV